MLRKSSLLRATDGRTSFGVQTAIPMSALSPWRRFRSMALGRLLMPAGILFRDADGFLCGLPLSGGPDGYNLL